MRAILLATTAALALSTSAWAASNSSSNSNGRTNSKIRQELTQMLQKSGFTDIRVAPTAFMIRAKDQDGNPVVMSISPDQFAEMTVSGNAVRSDDNAATNTVGSNSSDEYVTVPSSDELSSKLVGLDIYNKDNKDIGTIKDIALNPNGRAAAFIVG